MKKFFLFFSAIKVPVDFIMTVLAFISAYQLRLITEPHGFLVKPIDYTQLPTEKEYLIFSLSAATGLIAIFAFSKMYQIKTTSTFAHETKKAFIGCAIWIMAIISYFFFIRSFPFSRLALFYSWAFTLIFILLGRYIIKLIQKSFFIAGYGQTKLLFIGNNQVTREINQVLKKNPSYQILGVIGKENSQTKLKLLGKIEQLKYILKKYKIDQIIQTENHKDKIKEEEILEYCELNHIGYKFVPDLLEVHRTNIEVETLAGIPIINLKPTPLDGWGKITKRLFDIILATIALIILSPVLFITAIAIKLDSKGPVLFTKLDDGSPVKRVGQKGELFKFYKFRSMKPNTHNMRYTDLAKNNSRGDGPLVKIENDPRITRVGKFIRKYSIDELPQLWNVIIGNISLVGPRPHLPEEVAKYQNHQKFVLTIKPGITGLSQISGRSDLSFEEEVKLDTFYIENWSIWLDLKIMLRTIKVLFKSYKE